MIFVKAIFKYEYDESVVQLEEMKLPQEGTKESLLDEDGLMTLDVTGKNPGRTELKGKLVLISYTISIRYFLVLSRLDRSPIPVIPSSQFELIQ